MYAYWNSGTNAWDNNERDIYTYDANNNQTSNVSQTWNGTTWVTRNRNIRTYDSNQYEISYSYNGGSINGSWGYGDSTRNYSCRTMTAINEVNANTLHAVLYPNPASNQLSINLNGLQAEQISIYNVDGKLVSDAKQPANNSVDISALAKGVYVAEVKAKEGMQRLRWVKL